MFGALGIPIDGRSIAGAAFLAAVSLQLDAPLPHDFVCSISLDVESAEFTLSPVGGLEEKVAAVANFAPGIERIIVHERQDIEAAKKVACELGRRDLTFHRVGDLSELLHTAFACRGGDEVLVDHLMYRALEGLPSFVLVDHLTWCVLESRSSAVDWRPVERAVQWLKAAHDDAHPRDVELEMLLGVVSRYNTGHAGLDLLTPREVGRLPHDFVKTYAAHLILQCADAGFPDFEIVRELGEEFLPDDWIRNGTATDPDLRIAGALGQLYALRGRLELAWEYEQATFLGWARRSEWRQANIALGLLYRIAGQQAAAGDSYADAQRIETAERFALLVDSRCSTRPETLFERGRALVLLNRCREARSALRLAKNAPRSRHELFLRCERWSLRVARLEGVALDRIAERVARLASSASSATPRDQAQLCLMEMELALAYRDHVGAKRACTTLRNVNGSILSHLECGYFGQSEAEKMRFVTDRYPY